ncbi:exo-beta-N-acetylmuramidase NamZ domain-containing protein [Bowmanella sp. JS7-9]|uniref:Exo-beta-N-acetylmuramidase NamZ domain-containing protein n=1 Tax=Pseudobowmanella zhangzhouensis TaxID=1537679 RepID=A0ABW1XNJ7_9ALTE|nr:DUF1343 domain-containing protein [Bowmanella sp. JS7-9]TBX22056.1 hypothetical protein TK45_11335 [Bowmanella sp. JS7-9]
MRGCIGILCVWLLALCQPVTARPAIEIGAERSALYLPMLKGKVGLVVNQTSRVGQQHLLDYLLAQGVDVRMVFAPEHGFRGEADAGAHISDGVDERTGVPIVSIYGQNKKPGKDVMSQLDWVIFDIQDVGARFYTYISSMHYMMETAAENHVRFMVLDRPNPNGSYVRGPIREDAFTSFVGMHPIPLLHGMTVGELAQMINGEGWLAGHVQVDLTVIPMRHYQRSQPYSLPVSPSPNLPNDSAIALYPSLCLFEPTTVSVGRGTPFPFQVIGHPQVALGPFEFTPVSGAGAAKPKWQDTALQGIDLRQSSIHGLDLTLLVSTYQAITAKGLPFFTSESFFDKLAGTDKLRKALVAGQSAGQIEASWQQGEAHFMQQRQPYLLYDLIASEIAN